MANAVTHSEVSSAADRLGNAFRLYTEASITAKALFAVDREEAIDNIDRAFDGILAGFHSLYDIMDPGTFGLDWNAHGDTAVCILVRNARHHNAGSLFDSWNCRMLKRGGLKAMAGAEFLLVGYKLVDDGGHVAEYYVPWDDFRARLTQPKNRIKDPAAWGALLDRDCAFDTIRKKAMADGYPVDQVYLNLVPIAMNAASRVFAALRAAGIVLSGYDSRVFADHFASAALVDLRQPTFKSLRAPSP